MMITLFKKILAAVGVVMLASVANAQTAQTPPDELVRTVSQGVLDEIKADRTLQATGNLERLNAYRDWETDRKSTRLNSSH